jgi:putative phosphoesterase
MFDETVAVISDIHGNRWALESVMEDIGNRGIRNIVNLGDCLYGPLDPAGTARILMKLDVPTVRGNEDRIIVQQRTGDELSPTLQYVLENLDSCVLKWLEDLPITRVAYDDFFLCHGSPSRDDEYLLDVVSPRAVVTRSADDLEDLLRSVKHRIICCGHDHVARTVYLRSGKVIVNPGSVGLQAYSDDTPYPHVMETGATHACYCVIDSVHGIRKVKRVFVPYDHETAARRALKNGRPDWAGWLRTGVARDSIHDPEHAQALRPEERSLEAE